MIKRILLILLVIIIALPVVVWFGAPAFADYELRKVLAKADTASFSYLELDLWQGDLVVHDIFMADSSGSLSKQPIAVALDRFSLKGLDLWKAYREKRIVIDSLVVGKGYVHIPLYKDDGTSAPQDTIALDTTQVDVKPEKLPLLQLKLFSLRHVAIDSIGFRLSLNAKNPQEKYSGVIHLVADSISVPLHEKEAMQYGNLDLRLQNLYAQPRKSKAYFMLDTIVLSSRNKTATLHGIKMRQRISERRYANYFGFDKVYATADVNRVTLFNIPTKLEQFSDGLRLSRIEVFAPQAYLYKNNRLPHPKKEKIFIIEAIQDLAIPIHIDTVDVVDGQLFFNLNWREDYVPGRIDIANMNVRMLNYTNLPDSVRSSNWTTIKGSLNLYNELALTVDWKFDLRKRGTAFTLDLGIGSTDFAVLNPFTENTVGLHFDKGRLNSGRMLVEGNKENGAGTLELYYEDLKLQLLDKEDHHENILHWAGAGIANWVVRNNNIETKEPRLGIVYTEPIADRAIFQYVIKMFFSGFMDIALSSENEEKVAARGMVYLPMPKQAQAKIEKVEQENSKKRKKEEKRKAKEEAKKQ